MKWLIILLISVLSWSAQAQIAPSLADIGITLAENQTLPLAEKIQLEFKVADAAALRDKLQTWRNVSAELTGSGKVRVTISGKPQYTGAPQKKHSTPSFVIDLEQPSTQAFFQGYQGAGLASKLSGISQYVADFIHNPTYVRGFDIASVVAKNRSGDCTEYAVLATALARAMGFPARVVMGSVIVDYKTRVVAAGHAWTEIWWQGQWHTLDAALHSLPKPSLYYIPVAALENEGPGYLMSAMVAISLFPTEMTNLKSL